MYGKRINLDGHGKWGKCIKNLWKKLWCCGLLMCDPKKCDCNCHKKCKNCKCDK